MSVLLELLVTPFDLAHVSVPFVLSIGVSKALFTLLMDPNTTVSYTSFVIFIGVAMSITAFPVLARILTERKLLDTT